MKIKNIIVSFIIVVIICLTSIADEGMWIPSELEKVYLEMKKLGLNLTLEQMYSVQNPSLKDAIVMLDYGQCTAELISPDGLMLTNHHCAYGDIQSHSSVENNYLKDGFWAENRSEELPCKGKTASLLIRIEKVTDIVLKNVTGEMTASEREEEIDDAMKKIKNEAELNTGYEATVYPMLKDNEYYLYVYETYKDVRLVGAPPSSIGKFGGETDNWMWPRHTGDFSLFRIYASPDGKPAEYSDNNVPLKSRYYLPVSVKGYKENDYTMIWGYPGTTERYMTSYGITQKIEQLNPASVKLKYKKMQIMKEYMDSDAKIKIQYADKYANLSNFWKKDLEETKALRRLKVADEKRKQEQDFLNWAEGNSERKQIYGNVIKDYEEVYRDKIKFKSELVVSYIIESTFNEGCEVVTFPFQMRFFVDSLNKKKINSALINDVKKKSEEHFKNYNEQIDRKIFLSMFEYFYKDIPKDMHPSFFKTVENEYKGNFSKYADYVYKNSIFASEKKFNEFLKNPDTETYENDPAYNIMQSLISNYMVQYYSQFALNSRLSTADRLFVAGLREMYPDKNFYPDANSSMRVTYGKVIPYVPRDAVFYNFSTTLEGVIEKEDETNEEFFVPEKLKQIYDNRDYGRYSDNGKMNICFIADNDITGGNSGSPVINANGELIGVAFDGNTEAMSSDILFNPALQRTIICDIRYVLFIIDKFAGATNLIDEMKIVE